MLSDLEIAQQTPCKPIKDIAEKLNIAYDDLIPYGHDKAKLSTAVFEKNKNNPDGALILVSAITPTPAGEGKTTTTIALGDALNLLGKKAVMALREPSLGPCFGVKGGAAGGGYAQVQPMEEINLHFTGDMHAIGTAHNLLSAMVDNHLIQGNELQLDTRRISWKRVVDLNDRALRNIVLGLGGEKHGVPRESGYDITVASEVMACLCLATDLKDLQRRFGNIIVGFTGDKQPVRARDIGADGSMTVLMKEAIKPNLVQTLEHNPVIMHGGPFANIAHGCNSLMATKLSLKLADYVVTEAGFGFDLGGEKFLDIKCPTGGLKPKAIVLVATIRALKYHGGMSLDDIKQGVPNAAAVWKGLPNLSKHINNAKLYGVPVIVNINKFSKDTAEEIAIVEEYCKSAGVPVALNDGWAQGGKGAIPVAETLIKTLESSTSNYQQLYDWNLPIQDKITTIATKIYGADGVSFDPLALEQIELANSMGLDKTPVCIAKTQSSLSDNPKLLGAPTGFTVNVKNIRFSAGAGFLVVLTGDIMTMPGLPKKPAALQIGVDENGKTVGLF